MEPKIRALHPHKEKVYVKVTSDTDATGYTEPKMIIWPDGRKYPVEDVKDFCPAGTVGRPYSGDCYTVVVRGQRRRLFYEQVDDRFCGRHGRWFVEVTVR